MSGGQNYLLPAMDVAKVGGPLLVVKVCAQLNIQVHSLLLYSYANFVGCSYI